MMRSRSTTGAVASAAIRKRAVIIPAYSGVKLIWIDAPEGAVDVSGDRITQAPVIAWEIDGNGIARAAISIGRRSDVGFTAIVMPDGEVRDHDGNEWRDVDGWMEWALNKWKEVWRLRA